MRLAELISENELNEIGRLGKALAAGGLALGTMAGAAHADTQSDANQYYTTLVKQMWQDDDFKDTRSQNMIRSVAQMKTKQKFGVLPMTKTTNPDGSTIIRSIDGLEGLPQASPPRSSGPGSQPSEVSRYKGNW